MNRLQKAGAASAIATMATGVVGGFEGLRQIAYPDPATRGYPWTICYGHTGRDVSPGEHAALGECKRLLLKDLNTTANGLENCVHVPLPDTRYVALLSLGYNIGVGGLCRSSIVRDLNAGRTAQACARFPSYNRAAGIVFPGLTRRRLKEEELCEEGL
jgi:lysozyme